jgi:hypothetical protein
MTAVIAITAFFSIFGVISGRSYRLTTPHSEKSFFFCLLFLLETLSLSR